MMVDLDNILRERYVVTDDKSELAQIRAIFTADLAAANISGDISAKLVRIMDEGLANVVDHSEDMDAGEERGYGEYSVFDDRVEISFITYNPKVKKEDAEKVLVGASQQGLDRIAVYKGEKSPEETETMKGLTKEQLKAVYYKNRGLGLAMMELLSGNEPEGRYLKNGCFELVVTLNLPVSKPEN